MAKKQEWNESHNVILRKLNLPRNTINQVLVRGCQYHTKWQSHVDMYFTLVDFTEKRATCRTRNGLFKTNVNSLIFKGSVENLELAQAREKALLKKI